MVLTPEHGQRKVGIESLIRATESGTWTVVHGNKPRVWPMESGPWTTVHSINTREWPTKNEPWTVVHGIES